MYAKDCAYKVVIHKFDRYPFNYRAFWIAWISMLSIDGHSLTIIYWNWKRKEHKERKCFQFKLGWRQTCSILYTVRRLRAFGYPINIPNHYPTLTCSLLFTRIDYMISPSNYQMFSYTGWPIKTETAYFQHYEGAITGISAWGNF